MEFAVYAPPDILLKRPDALDRLQERSVRLVILRSADAVACSAVTERGMRAWWLAPGLWGRVEPQIGRQVQLPAVPEWTGREENAFEAQWKMYCPTDPRLPAQLAAEYVQVARAIGASGIHRTHFRYQHPANVTQLWGCVCPRCLAGMAEKGLDLQALGDFWARLARRLRCLPIGAWSIPAAADALHPLLGWWQALTGSDFPNRWFAWKNATLQRASAALSEAIRDAAPELTVASNGFEPFWAVLVGHSPAVLRFSSWYSPLLGYWSTHVRQSAVHLGLWHARLAQLDDVDSVLKVLEAIMESQPILSDPRACLEWELRRGAAIAVELGLPYWPVVNGTSDALVPLGHAVAAAERVGASGVVLQGVSQLLCDPSLDVWY